MSTIFALNAVLSTSTKNLANWSLKFLGRASSLKTIRWTKMVATKGIPGEPGQR
jgi:hypothetical protein